MPETTIISLDDRSGLMLAGFIAAIHDSVPGRLLTAIRLEAN